MSIEARSPDPRPGRKGVIFDFEGTLVDFQWQLGPAEAELRAALAELGFGAAEFAQGNYAAMWNGAANQLEPHGRLGELRRALSPIYDHWDADALTRWLPRPGAAQLLERLRGAGLSVGIVSNIGHAALSKALSRFDFARFAAPVLSRDDVTRLKPQAQGILRVLQDWQLDPDEVLFVGDSRADVVAARSAGLAVAIIRDGENDESAFAGNPPDHMISQLHELAALLRLATPAAGRTAAGL